MIAMIQIYNHGEWFEKDTPYVMADLERIPNKGETFDLNEELDKKLTNAINIYEERNKEQELDSIGDFHWVEQVGYRMDINEYCIMLSL